MKNLENFHIFTRPTLLKISNRNLRRRTSLVESLTVEPSQRSVSTSLEFVRQAVCCRRRIVNIVVLLCSRIQQDPVENLYRSAGQSAAYYHLMSSPSEELLARLRTKILPLLLPAQFVVVLAFQSHLAEAKKHTERVCEENNRHNCINFSLGPSSRAALMQRLCSF